MSLSIWHNTNRDNYALPKSGKLTIFQPWLKDSMSANPLHSSTPAWHPPLGAFFMADISDLAIHKLILSLHNNTRREFLGRIHQTRRLLSKIHPLEIYNNQFLEITNEQPH